ncbi:hypothetical protein V1264_008069 [Littorina saxatilis]|uniref:DDE Tnp4 domain-containing protein n=1 Tax=Littorina saxatilis TaxID=31220 RepID=A0AAN9ATN3_9CAEN
MNYFYIALRDLFQVVCDKDLFLDVFTGYDSRVFRNSDLVGVASNLPPEFHVIGDSAYPLCDYLLVPFRDKAQTRTRVDVERAIGLLNEKFRRLKDLDMTNIREVPTFIFSACVLHNFIILDNGVDEDDIDLSDSNDEDEEGGQCGGDHCMSAHKEDWKLQMFFLDNCCVSGKC